MVLDAQALAHWIFDRTPREGIGITPVSQIKKLRGKKANIFPCLLDLDWGFSASHHHYGASSQ